MSNPRFPKLVAATLLGSAIALVSMPSSSALAHERRDVGKYQFVVGFQTEPAIQGEPNGPSLRVTIPSEEGKPVTGLAENLKVAVAYGGGQPKEFPLSEIRSQPGLYHADFIPTRAGSYIFNFSGTIEGTAVNERFESGPGRFDDIQPAERVQFPEPIPPGNEIARTARAASERAADAEAAAAGARTLAMAGVGIGLIGALLGIAGLAAATRRPRSSVSPLAQTDAR
jgi:hypothetical protein